MVHTTDQAIREQWINDPKWALSSYVAERKPWMSDNQWDQATKYMRGLAIPTDPEIVSALRGEPDFQGNARGHVWAWSSVPAVLVDDGYLPWCTLIREKYDPDLMVAEGL